MQSDDQEGKEEADRGEFEDSKCAECASVRMRAVVRTCEECFFEIAFRPSWRSVMISMVRRWVWGVKIWWPIYGTPFMSWWSLEMVLVMGSFIEIWPVM